MEQLYLAKKVKKLQNLPLLKTEGVIIVKFSVSYYVHACNKKDRERYTPSDKYGMVQIIEGVCLDNKWENEVRKAFSGTLCRQKFEEFVKEFNLCADDNIEDDTISAPAMGIDNVPRIKFIAKTKKSVTAFAHVFPIFIRCSPRRVYKGRKWRKIKKIILDKWGCFY